MLFAALEARRGEGTSDPLILTQVAGEAMIAPPPPLVLPAPQVNETYVALWPSPTISATPAPAPETRRAQVNKLAFVSPRPRDDFKGWDSVAAPHPPHYTSATVAPEFRSSVTIAEAPDAPQSEVIGDRRTAQRVKAGTFANPATTIPQGAVIQAVLETALDSTRAGSARAMVSRDVRSFDGSRVLIPRGSRLYGEYKADLALGQNRALIQWTRLMRPDGAVVALDSPSADPLGRAGVKGKVNTHFLQRFGGTLLQSALDIGVGLAARGIADGTVIVGLPGSTQSIVTPTSPESVRPTLKVAQGTPVSVFVARDLDFTEVER